MRIMLLANHFNTGGIASYLMTLTAGLTRRGHQVWIATSGGDCAARAEALGARHILIPQLKVKCEFHPGLYPAAAEVARFIRANDIEILHAQTRVTQSAAALACSWTGRPYVSTCHGYFKPRLARRLFPLWGRGVVAISRPVVEHLVRDLGVDRALISLVPNGIDTQRYCPQPERQRALRQSYGIGNEPVVGIVARLSDVKGHAVLIRAMNELIHERPGIKCLIFGEGPMEQALRSLVAQLNLTASVLFFNKVSGRTADLFPMFDVFAMPSLQEGLGLSVMEAQACAVPVVATRVGGLVEAVIDGETGLLVPPGDHLALADALAKVLFDKSLAGRLATSGRERILAHFTVAAMVDGTLEAYRKVLGHA